MLKVGFTFCVVFIFTNAQIFNGVFISSCWSISSGAGSIRVVDMGTNTVSTLAIPQSAISNPGIKAHIDRQTKTFTIGYRASSIGYVNTYSYNASSVTLQRNCNLTIDETVQLKKVLFC